MPTAEPMIAASASGLSITRCEPNLRWRSSVTRKTPPSTPTSSPRISTSRSRSISSESAWLSAFTMLSLVMLLPSCHPLAAHRRRAGWRRRLVRLRRSAGAQPRRDLVALGPEVGRHPGVHVVERRQRVGRRRGLEASDRLVDLVVHLLLESLPPEAPPPPVAREG